MRRNFEFMLADADEFSRTELRQGDIIERTPDFAAVLAEAHRHYAEAAQYEYFMVLTPTCNLVIRDGKCSSRYISIAAIRPLSVLLNRQLENYKRSFKGPAMVCMSTKRKLAEQYVDRILHNEIDGYVFLPGEFFIDGVDRCAFLVLSVALRASHYSACLAAKRMQLSVDFSAKVGQLASNLYGQVATAALEEQLDINAGEIISQYRSQLLDSDGVYWLSPQGHKLLQQKCKAEEKTLGRSLSPEEVAAIVSGLPSDEQLLADRVITLLSTSGYLSAGSETAASNAIASDTIVRSMLKAV